MLSSSYSQSAHLLKVRRVSTYNHPVRTRASLDQSFAHLDHSVSPGSPYFKEHSHSQLVHKKDNFITSLISKLKNVERHPEPPISCRPSLLRITDPKGIAKNEENKNNSRNISILGHTRKPERTHSTHSFSLHPTQSQPSLANLQLENAILRQKLHEAIMENEKLKLRITHATHLQEKEEALLRQQEQLSSREADLALREQLLKLDSPKQTREQLHSLSFSNLKLESSKLTLCKPINEVVLPVNSQPNAASELRQARLEKLELERKFTASLSQYRRKKEEEMERIKRTFTTNLAHYKDLLLKLTTKKHQEDTFETAILETSSAEES